MALTPVTDQTFDSEVLSANQTVVVDFWAEWCGPCRQLMPLVQEVAAELPNVKFVKVNIDENPETPSTYGVRGIPTLMVFKGGKLVETKVGSMPKSALKTWVESNV
ncbi:MAG: thioredoxin [Alphaproteobacteria bacterium]